MLFAVKSETMLTGGGEVKTEMPPLAGQKHSEQASRAIRLFSQAALDLRNSASPTLPLEMALVEATLDPTPVIVTAPAAARTSPAASSNPFVPSTPSVSSATATPKK